MRSTLIVKTLHLNTLKQDVQPDMYAFYLKFSAYPKEKKLHLSYKDQQVNDV
jgi:hypothetical protein